MVKVVKPGDEQAVTIELGYDQKVKLDLTAVADEKLTLVHIGEKLIILFDNKSTVTVHPFFDSMGVPLSNVSVGVSPTSVLPSGDFASTVPHLHRSIDPSDRGSRQCRDGEIRREFR